MDKKIGIIAGITIVVMIIIATVYFVLPSDSGGDELTATINGIEYSWEEMLASLETKRIDGDIGVSLSAIINDTALSNPESRQYQIVAEDGYYRNVTWGNMMEGVLLQVEEDGNLTLKTSFPSLPSRYKIKFVTEINPVNTDTVTVNGREYTWEQPFDRMFNETNISGYVGIRLSDLVNHTALSNPEAHEYNLIASDGYNKTVNWTSMINGVLVEFEHKTAFAGMSGSYRVKDLITIEVI